MILAFFVGMFLGVVFGYLCGIGESKSLRAWVSVDERMPYDEDWVFICVNDNGCPQSVGMGYHLDGKWYDSNDMPCNVDYWMDIPHF